MRSRHVKLPSATVPCFKPSGPMHGKATFQLFDDGWRIQSAPVSPTPIDAALVQQATAEAANAAAQAEEIARKNALAAAERSLADSGDLAKTDTDGVLWSRKSSLYWYTNYINVQGKKFSELEDICGGIKTPGHAGYRMPSIAELNTLLKRGGAFNQIMWIDAPDHMLLHSLYDQAAYQGNDILSTNTHFYVGGTWNYSVIEAYSNGSVQQTISMESSPSDFVLGPRDRILCVDGHAVS